MSNALWTLTAAELVQAYAARTATPSEALQSVLDRHDAVNPQINAVVALDRDGAKAAAADSTERWRSGASNTRRQRRRPSIRPRRSNASRSCGATSIASTASTRRSSRACVAATSGDHSWRDGGTKLTAASRQRRSGGPGHSRSRSTTGGGTTPETSARM